MNETTEMTNDATPEGHVSPGPPAPPLGEAAALVARLLSGCDQDEHAVVGEDTPSAMDRAQLASADSDPVPAVSAPADLPVDHVECAVPGPSSATALLPYSNITVALVVFVLVGLTFGSGLAVGYGVLGRLSKGSSRSTLRESKPPAARNAAASEKVDDQASVLNGADAPPVNPTATLVEPTASTLTPLHADVLSDGGSDNALQKPAAQAQGGRSERAQTAAEPPRVPVDSSLSGKSLGLVRPDPGESAATAVQPVNMPPSRPPASDGMPAVGTSTQPVHPEKVPIDSVHTENVLTGGKAPDIRETPGLPGVDPAATEANVLPDGLSEEPRGPISASPGHIDPCQLIRSVQPVYPQKAKSLHVEGQVELRVVVGVDGTVTSVGLVSGPPLLVPAAMDAARGFRYKSASLNGQPIETVQTIDMSFKLKN